MRLWVAFVLVCLPFMAGAHVPRMRELYFAAASDAGITAFYNEAKKSTSTDPVMLAYKGVAIAMYAEVASKVKEKFAYFEEGKTLIDQAAAAAPRNAEIAFLRFSVQSEVPAFLGYRDQIQNDANIVVAALRGKQIDPTEDFWKKALQFMKKSGKLNSLQLSEINRYLS
jgi:hypothetical protein